MQHVRHPRVTTSHHPERVGTTSNSGLAMLKRAPEVPEGEMRVQVSVACELSPMCQAALPGFQRCGRPGGGTVLLGEVADQATLMRLLQRLNDFGLSLLEFRQLPD